MRAEQGAAHLSELQELDSVEGLRDVWDLLVQAGHATLQVGFHELVFPVGRSQVT